jgi:YVTN family beta-propeller protein
MPNRPVRRVISLTLPLLIVLGTVVAGLTPVTASAASTPITAYVINNLGNTVTPIDVTANTPGAPIPAGTNPRGVAVTPDGKTAYVTNRADNTVTPIDVATNIPGAPIPRRRFPVWGGVHPRWENRIRCQQQQSRRDAD